MVPEGHVRGGACGGGDCSKVLVRGALWRIHRDLMMTVCSGSRLLVHQVRDGKESTYSVNSVAM